MGEELINGLFSGIARVSFAKYCQRGISEVSIRESAKCVLRPQAIAMPISFLVLLSSTQNVVRGSGVAESKPFKLLNADQRGVKCQDPGGCHLCCVNRRLYRYLAGWEIHVSRQMKDT